VTEEKPALGGFVACGLASHQIGMKRQIFDESDLSFFALDTATATVSNLTKAYRRRALQLHADKPSVDVLVWKAMRERYDALMRGFQIFEHLKQEHPRLSMESVTRRAFPSATPQVSIPVAPKWHVKEILKEPLRNIEEALRWLPDGLLEDNSIDLAQKLRQMSPSQEYTVKLRGVAQPADEWSVKYHGTSWSGVKEILLDAFLPTYGAGMAALWKTTGETMPLVYTSPSPECAQTYPQALVDKDKRYCGEVVASDICCLRPYLTCGVNAHKRKVKIRKGFNKQDAYCKDDVWATAVTFCAYTHAPPEQLQHYNISTERISTTISPAPGQAAPNTPSSDEERGVPQHGQVEGEHLLMSLRQHGDDDRTSATLSAAILELLSMRCTFLQRQGLPEGTILDGPLMQKFWNEDLKNAFLEEMHVHDDDTQRSNKRLSKEIHGRFSVWIHLAFGDKNTVRGILAEGLGADVVDYMRSI
jgi:hypothetical protein